jgi:hypothetical protein
MVANSRPTMCLATSDGSVSLVFKVVIHWPSRKTTIRSDSRKTSSILWEM